MAHGNKTWSVSHGRIILSFVIGVIGVFILFGAIGMTNWVVGAVGLALVAGAAGLFAMSALNSRAFAFVPGTGHVVSASEPPASATEGRINLHIVVTTRNRPGVAVKIRDAKVPVSKWPDAGADLPILVAVTDPRRVRVLWDEVRPYGAVVRQPAPPDIETIPDSVGSEDLEPDGYGSSDDFLSDDYPTEPIPVDVDEGGSGLAGAGLGDPGLGDPGLGDPDIGGAAVVDDPDGFTNDATVGVVSDAEAIDPRSSARADDDAYPSPATRIDAGFDDGDLEDDLDDLVTVIAPGHGGQVIELDVMDPLVVRWSTESTPISAPPANPRSDPPTWRPPSSKPSPRPRRPPDETITAVSFADPPPAAPPMRAPQAPAPRPADVVDAEVVAEDLAAAGIAPATTADAPTMPLQFHQARVITPAVAAEPDPPFDQAVGAPATPDPAGAAAAAIADAYLTATPPPGISRPSRIRSVAVTLFVTDLPRSVVFYRDTLGFTETDAGHGSAVMESGDARIVLRRVAMPPVDRRLVQLLLEVPDVLIAYDDLRARGVSFIHRPRPVGQYEQSELWSAAFRDPDGHGIAITQWRSLT